MNTNQSYVLASVRNAAAFLDQHAELFAGRIKPAFRTRLTTALANIEATIAEQQGLTRKVKGNAEDRAARRTVLVNEHMAPIARVARLELPNNPSIGQFGMPSARLSTEKLAAAASGMAEAALPFRDIFTAEALPEDFITQLTEARDAMLGSSQQRAAHASQRKGATTGLRTQLTEARAIVHAIDALVRPVIKGDPTLLASWKSISRVQKPRTTAPLAKTPAPAVPTPQATLVPPRTAHEHATHNGERDDREQQDNGGTPASTMYGLPHLDVEPEQAAAFGRLT